MVTHDDVLKAHKQLGSALYQRYRWFIHTTPIENISAIMTGGLQPQKDRAAPQEVLDELGQHADYRICLHPLGAKIVPGGVMINKQSAIDDDPPKVATLALCNDGLPPPVGLDWSYEWLSVVRRLGSSQLATVDAAMEAINEYGAIVTYKPIPPESLRVFCNGCSPVDPSKWRPLVGVSISDIISI